MRADDAVEDVKTVDGDLKDYELTWTYRCRVVSVSVRCLASEVEDIGEMVRGFAATSQRRELGIEDRAPLADTVREAIEAETYETGDDGVASGVKVVEVERLCARLPWLVKMP